MAIVDVVEKGIGREIRGKLGNPSVPDPLGHYGIYQVRKVDGKQTVAKKVFYTPTNPQTQAQQDWRAVLTNGVSVWQALTQTQKDGYNERARYKRFSGYNLYLREYLLSH